ncbi:MAG: 16S rRNA (cytosine(1402)-N(4))-methyltransferase RsmH [Terriglobia bacterium]
MKYRHDPVMLAEAIAALRPRTDGTYVDATTGGAGHLGAIIDAVGTKGRIVALDKDTQSVENLANAAARLGQHITIVHDSFLHIKRVLGDLDITGIDGILFDLGLSSAQVDEAARGFSYMKDGPLDMRYDQRQAMTAHDVVNNYSERKLSRLISDFGEERWASRVAKFIAAKRQSRPIETTGQLVEIIKNAIPAGARRKGGHPAKRVFQALRIEVNSELEALEVGLRDAVDLLRGGGRIVVISYHSLEDRLAKSIFRELSAACICPASVPECRCDQVPTVELVGRGATKPAAAEIERNPRARSARLRVAEKLSAA